MNAIWLWTNVSRLCTRLGFFPGALLLSPFVLLSCLFYDYLLWYLEIKNKQTKWLDWTTVHIPLKGTMDTLSHSNIKILQAWSLLKAIWKHACFFLTHFVLFTFLFSSPATQTKILVFDNNQRCPVPLNKTIVMPNAVGLMLAWTGASKWNFN